MPVSWGKVTLKQDEKNISAILPSNFLAGHTIAELLELDCSYNHFIIDPDAFVSSRNSLRSIAFLGCDLNGWDFSFLTGFNQLKILRLEYPSNIGKPQWRTVEIIPSLVSLHLDAENPDCWTDWINNGPRFINGLKEAIFTANCLEDELTDQIVQYLLDSSAQTLMKLELWDVGVTRIPPAISSFTKLEHFHLSCMDPQIEMLPGNSILFSVPAKYISIENCGIQEIIRGAFQGI